MLQVKGCSKYYVSVDGKVWYQLRDGSFRERKPVLHSNGYHYVNIRDDSKNNVNLLVHRMVAQAYIPNPHGLRDVNHIDGNRTNNRLSNLEWLSHSDNMRDAHRRRSADYACAILG